MFSSSKAQLIKFLDAVNPANEDSLTKQGLSRFKQLKCMTASLCAGSDCDYFETIITSGGSEANCLAIKSVIHNTRDKPHIISTSYEHSSILNCLKQLQQ